MDLGKLKNSSNEWLFISTPPSRAPTPELDWDQCSTHEAEAEQSTETGHFKKAASWELRPINPSNPVSNKPAAMSPSPRQPTPYHNFFNLPLNTENEVKIQTLIKDLAEKNFLQLGASSITLNQRGVELKVVHPMRFMGHILSDPTLSNHWEVLKTKSFVYNRFVAEFTDHMKEKERSQGLLLYANGFAKHVGVETLDVVNVINSKKYADLIHLKKSV